MVEKYSQTHLWKIEIEHISGSASSLKCYKYCFYRTPSWGLPQNTLKLSADHLILPYIKLFKITKMSGTSLQPDFLHDFWRKMFLTLHFIKWPNFNTWLPILLEILGNKGILIICCPVFNVINFEIYLGLFIKPFFNITKKSWQKCKYLKKEKSF